MAERRKDSKKRVLKGGEYQRSNGTYEYRWRSENGKRNNVYAKSLEELREKEAEIQRDRSDGIRSEARNATINDIHEQWLQLKKGLKANTLVNYEYMYKMYVFPEFGMRKVVSEVCVNAHDKTRAVSSVGKACAAPYVWISNKLCCIGYNRRAGT